jgi:hypothetical protein
MDYSDFDYQQGKEIFLISKTFRRALGSSSLQINEKLGGSIRGGIAAGAFR